MNAEPFRADETYPPVVTTADDGTPLKDGKGWTCVACGALFAEKVNADLCCVEPDLFRQTVAYTPPIG